MGIGMLPADRDRAELREAVKGIRQEWRERLSLASKVGEHTRLGKRAGVLLLDLRILEDRISEAGGEEELVFMICAQVAGGATLTQWCEHYGLQRGLVWAFLTEREEWFERYKRALKGVADEWVGEVVGLADEATEDTLGVSKLGIDTRLKAAGYYDKDRFGSKGVSDGTGGGTPPGLPAVVEVRFVDAREGRVIEGEVG